nr:hypothetical protein Iba_chr13fCG10980 [Ipomoea batatas]
MQKWDFVKLMMEKGVLVLAGGNGTLDEQRRRPASVFASSPGLFALFSSSRVVTVTSVVQLPLFAVDHRQPAIRPLLIFAYSSRGQIYLVDLQDFDFGDSSSPVLLRRQRTAVGSILQ